MHAAYHVCTRFILVRDTPTLLDHCRVSFLSLVDIAPPPQLPSYWSGERTRKRSSLAISRIVFTAVSSGSSDRSRTPKADDCAGRFCQQLVVQPALLSNFGKFFRWDVPSVSVNIVPASYINAALQANLSSPMKRRHRPAIPGYLFPRGIVR